MVLEAGCLSIQSSLTVDVLHWQQAVCLDSPNLVPKSWEFPEELLVLCQIPKLGNAASAIIKGISSTKGSINSAGKVKTRLTEGMAKQAKGVNNFPSVIALFHLVSCQKVLSGLGVSCPTSINSIRSTQLNLKFGKLILKLPITVYVGTHGGQMASHPLELELWAVVRHSMWVLRTEFGSATRSVNDLYC